jgi:hypothetical protein
MPKPDELWGVTPYNLALPTLDDPAPCPHANAILGRYERGDSAENPWINVSKPKDRKNGTWTCRACGQVGNIAAKDQEP